LSDLERRNARNSVSTRVMFVTTKFGTLTHAGRVVYTGGQPRPIRRAGPSVPKFPKFWDPQLTPIKFDLYTERISLMTFVPFDLERIKCGRIAHVGE